MKRLFIAVVGCVAAAATAVAPAQGAPTGAGAVVTYTYIGGSTPPRYHREFTIVVRDSVATIRVGTYGTVDGAVEPVATDSKRLDQRTWTSLIAAADSLPAAATGRACPGASTHRIAYRVAGVNRKATHAFTCAMGDPGQLAALRAYIAPVESRFDLDRLLAVPVE